ncbi:septation ring formation regulator EzrA [Bacillus sp. BGMRC 2118]|nr:septation ring formation regulator EzrA [Bacillus sp. BGMRC 2118]
MEFIIALILLIVVVLLFGVTIRKKVYKEVDRLEAWKIDIMNRPVTDELTMVKSLNMVGQTEELFEKWRNQWDEIVTTELPDIEEALFDIEESADKYRIRKANQLVAELNDRLHKIEESIQMILDELKELVGSEEKNRIEIEELKQVYRDVRRSLLAHSNTFGNAESKLESMLDEANEKFKEFDETVENGNVLVGTEIVSFIKERLARLQILISEVPALLKECGQVIPNQLDELLLGVKEMREEGFVLSHLQIEKEVAQIQQKLSEYLLNIENADIEPVKEGVADLLVTIDSFYDQLEKEVLSKHFVQKEVDPIHVSMNILYEETKETKIETEQVQLSYQLLDKDIEVQREIENQINTLIKRFSSVRMSIEESDIAYSIIKNELEDMKVQIEAIKLSHQEFINMLQALRKDETHVKDQLDVMRRMMIEAKQLVRKSNVPGLPESYLVEIQSCNEQIGEIADKLNEKPLHVPVLSQMLEKAMKDVERLTINTENIVEQAYLAEQVIQYGNRYRGRYLQLSEKLLSAEIAFRNFEYSRALEEAATALEKIEPGALKRIQQLLEEDELE